MHVTKAHAYGNDFLLTPSVGPPPSPGDLTRRLCDRHRGIGADGVIFYELDQRGVRMHLFNADGSASELSGNGLRCLGALVAQTQALSEHSCITVDTDAGVKTLELLARAGTRFTFRASLGPPSDIRRIAIPLSNEQITASILSMGNPQCVVLGTLPDRERFNHLGPALATHPMFPEGTNVEFAHVEAPDRVRIVIWERGVGPTSSSGTGASASAVAAAAHGGASRSVDVIAPGGTQRVDWTDEGVFLTGWAELLFEADWLAHE
jgi:diaminopimelate epimerase